MGRNTTKVVSRNQIPLNTGTPTIGWAMARDIGFVTDVR